MYLTQTKLSKKWVLAFAAALSAMILMLTALEADAAPSTSTSATTPASKTPAAPANVKQISAFGSYAKITWDKVAGTNVKYKIEVSQDKTQWQTLATVTNTYYTISRMETGKPYYIRVTTVVGANTGTTTSSSSSTISSIPSQVLQVITQPGYISEVKQTASKNTSVTVTWTAAAGAGAYDVYIGTSEDNLKYNQTIKTKTTATISKLKKDKTYIVKIVPFNVSPSNFRTNGFARSNTQVRTLPGKVTGLEFATWNYGSKNITVQWKAKDNADGYQVKFYNSANKCVKTISATGTKATFSKASANTFYKVRVRAYVLANSKKKYGAWNTTPVYPIAQPEVTSFSQAPGKLTIGWKQVDGATSYDIYVAADNNDATVPSAYTKVATVDKSIVKYELTKFGTTDITVTGNYYTYVVANKKVGKNTYSSKVTQAWYCCNN